MWKDIQGWEGCYQISENGQVRSLDRPKTINNKTFQMKGRILNEYLHSTGYPAVNLYNKNVRKVGKIHRLMALTFIPNPENKREVNHKNGIKTDYSLENLEWVTPSENVKHSYDAGLRGPNSPNTGKFGKDNHCSKKVNQYDKNMNFIATFDSVREAVKATGAISVSRAASGHLATSGGYIWKYPEGISPRAKEERAKTCWYVNLTEVCVLCGKEKTSKHRVDTKPETRVMERNFACWEHFN